MAYQRIRRKAGSRSPKSKLYRVTYLYISNFKSKISHFFFGKLSIDIIMGLSFLWLPENIISRYLSFLLSEPKSCYKFAYILLTYISGIDLSFHKKPKEMWIYWINIKYKQILFTNPHNIWIIPINNIRFYSNYYSCHQEKNHFMLWPKFICNPHAFW